MSPSPSRVRAWRRPAAAAGLFTVAVLTVTGCGAEDAPAVVTVTAVPTDAASAQNEGPAPTASGGGAVVGTDDGDIGADGHAGVNPTPGTAPAPGQQAPAQNTGSSGQMVLTGTVVDMTTSEIMEGQRTPNGEPETNGYIVLQLDSPQQITSRKSGSLDLRESTVTEVSLATPNGSQSSINWTGYVGTHVTVTTTADGLWLPSDTGLPLGMVRLSAGTVQ